MGADDGGPRRDDDLAHHRRAPGAARRRGSGGPLSSAILGFYLDYYEGYTGKRASGNHDALALAVATGLVRTTLSPAVDVTVDCSDGPARGRTVARLEGEWGTWPDREGARHRVVMEVEPGFEDRMVDLLASA